MEDRKSNAGRKPVEPGLKKTSKTLTMNDVQWNNLKLVAKESGYESPSEFLIKKFKLDKPRKAI